MGRGLRVAPAEAARRAALARNVRNAAKQAGFSIGALAAASGISQPTIYRRLAGETPFLVREVHAISEACRVTIGSLLDGAY